VTYEEMLREAFRRWNAGDFEASQEFMHPEIEWHTSGRFPDLEPVYRGLEGVRRFWRDFTAPWEKIVLEPIDFMVSGDDAVVAARFRALGRGGIEVDIEVFNRYRRREGKVVLVDTHLTRAEALEAAGLDEPAS
jgi:ketosteroid isomerase-like protein